MIADIIVAICLFALFTSIIINFTESRRLRAKKEKKSIVETGTMTLFFLGFYALIRFRIGAIEAIDGWMMLLVPLGLAMLVTGTIANIKGRLDLGSNWANQVKIYEKQTLTRRGMYGIVRHPLYASLILMFYGASIAYPNYLAFLANTFIFIPFMAYRARQEEELLSKRFTEYAQYKKEVGMLFPKLR
jgi:protein-S-isoprenylcysteine O-methyltransferase Ste14